MMREFCCAVLLFAIEDISCLFSLIVIVSPRIMVTWMSAVSLRRRSLMVHVVRYVGDVGFCAHLAFMFWGFGREGRYAVRCVLYTVLGYEF